MLFVSKFTCTFIMAMPANCTIYLQLPSVLKRIYVSYRIYVTKVCIYNAFQSGVLGMSEAL